VDVDEEEDVDKVVRTIDVDKVVEQIVASGCACRTSQKPNHRHLMQVLN
jgi:ribosome maturation protein Sdo1